MVSGTKPITGCRRKESWGGGSGAVDTAAWALRKEWATPDAAQPSQPPMFIFCDKLEAQGVLEKSGNAWGEFPI